MDFVADVPEVQRNERSGDASDILTADGYTVKSMALTYHKLLSLWEQLRKFRTLFSDLTRDDVASFVRYITSRDTLWLEIYKGDRLLGIVTLEGMSEIIDAEAHVLFMDRDLANKVPVCKAIMRWLFNNFPFHRLTVEIPEIYMAPVRLVNELGFKREGKKRQAALISGKWVDVFVLGLTREEALKDELANG